MFNEKLGALLCMMSVQSVGPVAMIFVAVFVHQDVLEDVQAGAPVWADDVEGHGVKGRISFRQRTLPLPRKFFGRRAGNFVLRMAFAFTWRLKLDAAGRDRRNGVGPAASSARISSRHHFILGRH